MACDICGCGGSNIYMGLLPNFKNKFIGVRYRYSEFHTTLAGDPTQFSHNYYNTFELWSGWNIGKRWQVLAFVPYYSNRQMDDDGSSSKNGLGDITLLVNYQLLHSRKSTASANTIEQILWIGGGIKLPTGSFKLDLRDSNTTVADINAQIGTGSTDFLVNLMHDLRINMFGINTSVTYKINTANSSGYRYGNKLMANVIGYYRLRFAGIAVSPNAGVIFENTEANHYADAKVQYTGGHVLSAVAGVEVSYDRIAIGFNVQHALAQDYAGGQTKMQFRGMAHISFAF
ncbi:MAG: hypothetical protein C5B59_12225 [Bacteroidetes bacterium]|nr:MAG: hypothetical protein C5B59_12225 [Bacteroidota bacterium]